VILKKITLHNFMSYGDSTLDMSSLSIACLTGHNGAGKSAILDAVTWALWESARSSSDELIRIGQSEMWVDLVFELEGDSYRVRRSRAVVARGAAKSSKGTLDFQVEKVLDEVDVEVPAGRRGGARRKPAGGSGSSDGARSWVALTGASMRETQTRINEVLRMDYDTFINSVYLRQGRADEFTTRAPGERKQVLSEILGLSYFERLAELARDEARKRKAEIDYLQAGLENVDELQEELQNAKAEEARLILLLNQTRERLDSSRVQLASLQEQLAELADVRARLEPTQSRLDEIAADIDHLQPSFDRLSERKRELDELMAAVPGMEQTLVRFNELKSKVEELDQSANQRQSLETRRLELRSTIATQRGRLEVELEHLQSQLGTLKEQREKLVGAIADRSKLQNDFGAYKKLVAQESEMSQRQEAYTQLSMRAEQLHTTIVEARLRLEAELAQQREMLAELQSLLTSREELESEGAVLNERSELLDRLEVEFESIEETGIALKQEIDVIDQQIRNFESQIDENAAKCRELAEAQSTMCPLCAAPIVDRAAVLGRYENLNGSVRQHISEHENRKRELEERRQQLRIRYIELKRELETRKRLDVQIGEFNARRAAVMRAEANCARTAQLVEELDRKLQSQDYAQVERESLVNIKAEMHKLDFDPIVFSSLQSQLRMQRNVEMRYQQYKRDQSELGRLNEQIPLIETSINDLQSQLRTNRFAASESDELSSVESQLAAIPYDRVEHDAARDELAKLFPLVDKIRDFDRVSKEKPEVDSQLAQLTLQLESKRAQQTALQDSVASWAARIISIPDIEAQQETLTSSISSLDETHQLTQRQLAVLETRIEQLQSRHANVEQKQSRLNTLLVEMNDYQFLVESFGKKGIQAIIIENAIPELEAEANAILARLTENQMHIGIVTQQKTKQGAIQETLEILIADHLGTRNYELYSGGESFKIDFAIRVALSRLLARRAGAKLQTLIIDEGFGSQDEESRARLMQAINSIRKDFARIIVVTHIAEIKDLFPVQIQIDKHSGVSEINVVRN
jgi:DNA repair protein SbcC/Rad50